MIPNFQAWLTGKIKISWAKIQCGNGKDDVHLQTYVKQSLNIIRE